MSSNQATLGNGCVCDSGCASCERLAEAFEAMREALRRYATSGHDVSTFRQAEAALALADKVRQ